MSVQEDTEALSPAANPFTPGFGSLPHILIGRDNVLLDVRDGLREGAGSPYRVNKVTGPRGIGKTTVLRAAADVASNEGWIVVNVDPSPHMMDEMLDVMRRRTHHLREDSADRRLSSFTLGPLGASWDNVIAGVDSGWRSSVEDVLDVVEARGSGVLFVIDEVSTRHEALQTFGKRFQILKSEGRSVALLAAGLPLNVDAFQQLDDTSFIRRAVPHELEDVDMALVRDAMGETFQASGRTIGATELRLAANATEGYPFLIQLVGYYIWRQSVGAVVTMDDVRQGIAAARRRIGETVHSSSMADLSTQDKKFLLSMADDDGPSRMADITERAGWSRSQSDVYRSRLLRAGLIRAAGTGYVAFAFPGLREYLLEHASTLVWRE